MMLMAIFPFKAGAETVIQDWGAEGTRWPLKYSTTDPGDNWETIAYSKVTSPFQTVSKGGPIATSADPSGNTDFTPDGWLGWSSGTYFSLSGARAYDAIWLYSKFSVPTISTTGQYIIDLSYDEDVEVYLNGNPVNGDENGIMVLENVKSANTLAVKVINDNRDFIYFDYRIVLKNYDWYSQDDGYFKMKATRNTPAINNGKEWYEVGYNDGGTEWVDVAGPFDRNFIDEGGSLCLRGYANIDKSTLPFVVKMDINVDDEGQVWLNGHYLGSNQDVGSFNHTFFIPDTYFVDGDNLLAIYFSDATGGDAYLNFSFSDADEPEIDYTDENGFNYHGVRNDNGLYEFTVTGYEGSSISVSIPDNIRSHPIVGIDEGAFCGHILSSISVASGLPYTSPGNQYLLDGNGTLIAATDGCTIPASVTDIAHHAFCSTSEVTMSGTTPPTWNYDEGIGCDLSHLTIKVSGTIDDFYAYQDAWPWAAMCLLRQGVPNRVEATISAQSSTSALHDHVGEDNLQFVTDLTLHGTINSYDIMIMRNKMIRLQNLDLSDVSIVYNPYEYYTGYCSEDDQLTGKAFAELERLQTIKLPRTLRGIDADAFANSPNIREVVMQEGLQYISRAFSGTAIEEITIPYSVISVEPNAFRETTLRKVTFAPQPEGVEEKEKGTSIGYCAFYGCVNLEEVTMSEGIVHIGNQAFSYCDNLSEITIPYSVEHVERAFSEWRGIQNLRKVTFAAKPDGVEPKEAPTTFAESLFSNSPNLQEVNFLGDVVRISESAFKDCPMLNKVVFNDGLLEIGPYAFHNCYSLTQVEIPYSVTVIDNNAFEGSALQTVRLSAKMEDPEAEELSQLKRIGVSAFSGCNLQDIILPDNLVYIDDNAFSGNGELTAVHLPSSVERIGESAFADCPKIKNYYVKRLIPQRVEMHSFSNYQSSILNVPKDPETTWESYYWNTEWSKFLRLNPYDANYNGSRNPIGDNDDGNGVDLLIPVSTRVPGIGNYVIYPRGGMVVRGEEVQPTGYIRILSDGYDFGSLIEDGNVTAEELFFDINVEANRWYFLSFPYQVNLSGISTPGRYVFRYYDSEERANYGSGGWKNLPAGQDYLEAGKGYIFQSEDEEWDDEGNLISKLSAQVPEPVFNGEQKELSLSTFISDDAQDASWNFLGNPYTCYYDLSVCDYNAPVTVWNGDGYDSYRPGDDSYILHPLEAFFVQKPEGVASIQFPLEGRRTYRQAFTEPSQMPRRKAKASSAERLFINLTLSDGNYTDRTRVVFNETLTRGYDLGDDASKFIASSVPQLYSLDSDGIRYSINERPMGDVPLGIIAPHNGSYTLSAQRMDKAVLMLDTTTGQYIDLTEGDYTFETAAGTFDSRFMLIAGDPDGIAQLFSATGVSIMDAEGGLSIKGLQGTAEVYSTTGALVATAKADGVTPLQRGVYVVKVNNHTAKVMVK